MATNYLTDTFIKNLKFTGQKKYFDGGGLYIFLTPNNSKLWRMRYFINGRERILSFGPYPLISLAEAREMRDEAKKLILKNVDPAEQKKLEEALEAAKTENVFEEIAKEWFENKSQHLAETTRRKIWGTLTKDVFPYLVKNR